MESPGSGYDWLRRGQIHLQKIEVMKKCGIADPANRIALTQKQEPKYERYLNCPFHFIRINFHTNRRIKCMNG
jgi:hypothetical protein